MRGDADTRGIAALFIVAAIIAVGVATAWVAETRSTSSGSGSGDPYRVRVTRGGHTLATFDLAALREMGTKHVVAQGRDEEGPLVLEVLTRAGAGDFAELTVIGTGVRDSGRLVLRRAAVTEDVVLDIAEKRGSVKIAGPDIAYERRVRDVTELQVR